MIGPMILKSNISQAKQKSMNFGTSNNIQDDFFEIDLNRSISVNIEIKKKHADTKELSGKDTKSGVKLR